MRSPTATSISPSSSFSSSTSIVASPLPPTLTNATSGPIATMVPSIVCPFRKRFAWPDASKSAAKSSSCSMPAILSAKLLLQSERFVMDGRFHGGTERHRQYMLHLSAREVGPLRIAIQIRQLHVMVAHARHLSLCEHEVAFRLLP